MAGNRLIGLILLFSGAGVALIAGLFLAVQVSNESLSAGGAVVGSGLAFIPVALLTGAGLYLFAKGGAEQAEQAEMAKQRQLLDILKSRGQVSVNDMALEMQVSVDSVRNMVHQLVGLQVFSGYVNRKDVVLYSGEARELRELTHCKNCGGAIQLVGKGVLNCRFCGTEYFLS